MALLHAAAVQQAAGLHTALHPRAERRRPAESGNGSRRRRRLGQAPPHRRRAAARLCPALDPGAAAGGSACTGCRSGARAADCGHHGADEPQAVDPPDSQHLADSWECDDGAGGSGFAACMGSPLSSRPPDGRQGRSAHGSRGCPSAAVQPSCIVTTLPSAGTRSARTGQGLPFAAATFAACTAEARRRQAREAPRCAALPCKHVAAQVTPAGWRHCPRRPASDAATGRRQHRRRRPCTVVPAAPRGTIRLPADAAVPAPSSGCTLMPLGREALCNESLSAPANPPPAPPTVASLVPYKEGTGQGFQPGVAIAMHMRWWCWWTRGRARKARSTAGEMKGSGWRGLSGAQAPDH